MPGYRQFADRLALLLPVLLVCGCGQEPANPAGQPSSGNPALVNKTAKPRLNYPLPSDVPALPSCRPQVELAYRHGQQIIWHIDEPPADAHRFYAARLAEQGWKITDNRSISSGTTINATKQTRSCRLYFGQPQGQPSTIVMLLTFEPE